MVRFRMLIAGLVLAAGAVSAQEATPTPVPCPVPADPALPVVAFHIGRGDASFSRGRFSAAAEAYTCALAAAPEDVEALVKRGYAFAALGDAGRAFADFDQAVALDEANASVYTHRGTLYTRLGNFGLAINDFTLAASLNPADPAPLVNRAIVHAIEGDFAGALADLDLAETLAPDYPPLHAAFAAVYSALAAQRYQTFAALTNNAPLPGGTPIDVLRGVDTALRTSDFSVWLPLLTPVSQIAPQGAP